MKKQIDIALINSTNIAEVESRLLKLLQELNLNNKVGFVSGIIFSDGPMHVQSNIARIASITDQLRIKYQFPIFSVQDVFYSGLFEKLEESKLSSEVRRPLMFAFWETILTSGFITDIFMTPRWELSEGARDEHKNAKKMGMKIHHINTK